MPSPTFNIPHVAAAQAQKHVTVNEGFDVIDAALSHVAQSATQATAPVAPNHGEAFILPAGATGFGSGAPGDIAISFAGAWHILTPQFGWRWHVEDQGRDFIFTPFGWQPGSVASPMGSALGMQVRDALVTASGASVTASGLIPARSIVLGVTSWTVADVTGASGYRVGDGTQDDRFGSSLGVTTGASNVGVVGPFAAYADTDVIVTAEGGNFTGGQIGLSALLIVPSPAPV